MITNDFVLKRVHGLMTFLCLRRSNYIVREGHGVSGRETCGIETLLRSNPANKNLSMLLIAKNFFNTFFSNSGARSRNIVVKKTFRLLVIFQSMSNMIVSMYGDIPNFLNLTKTNCPLLLVAFRPIILVRRDSAGVIRYITGTCLSKRGMGGGLRGLLLI